MASRSPRAPIPAEISEGLCALAEFAAVARSPIHFDHRGDIDYIPEPEGPARLVKQLALTTQALSLVRAEPEASLTTYVTACAVAQDTLPAQRRVVLEALLDPERSDGATTTAVAEATKYPTSTARRYLQELAALRLVDRQPAEQGRVRPVEPERPAAGSAVRDERTTVPDVPFQQCRREGVTE